MITVIADDLSGAAETAEQFRQQGFLVAVRLTIPRAPAIAPETGVDVQVLDTDSRSRPPADAAARVAAVLRGSRATTHLFVKKTDSLWRGNVAAELGALRDAGYRLVVAGALPALDRSVVNGEPLADGRPLRESAHWYLETNAPPRTVREALGLDDVGQITLGVVRDAGLPGALRDALHGQGVLVADGETDSDLAATVAAVAKLNLPTSSPVALVGSAGLAAAVAAHHRPGARPSGGDLEESARASRGVPGPFVVVGSGSASAVVQVKALQVAGVTVVEVDPRESPASGTVGDDTETRLLAALENGDPAALVLRSAGRVDPAVALAWIRSVSSGVLRRLPGLDLVLTGGETARVVLDHLHVDTLTPLGQIEHGAVVSHDGRGRLVATKPGSFGSPGVLVALVRHLIDLRQPRTTRSEPTGEPMDNAPAPTPSDTADTRPFIAVTMGDGAGVGPEVTVGALLDVAAYGDARPVVIGDTTRLRMGARALGVDADVVEITDPSDAVFSPGRINVIDPHLLSPDLPWGKVSAEAGNAAFHYIRIACELGMAGKVQGICTAPLNKAALHEAGHVFPGHTELLAHFMGVGEVSMMLSTPKIKVIHVTTHIGLVDAIAKIEPGLVERTVRRGWEALHLAGVSDPIIGVCAINPHAGENGLFGYGEEAEKITPAIEVLQAEGMRVAGPLPADTAFFLGGRGDYDLIVAMYHDQGHGPVKVLGIEAGVNITVGLPVIRTSVDHGTAFDIAGTGTVAVGSMIEALRQAVEMSPSPVAA